MELLIPGWMVLSAAALGGAAGGFVVVGLVWREYTRMDMARHNYMARMLTELRSKHNDWSDLSGEDIFRDGKYSLSERIMHHLLDRLYARGRPSKPTNKP
jgi:hypothetical protein